MLNSCHAILHAIISSSVRKFPQSVTETVTFQPLGHADVTHAHVAPLSCPSPVCHALAVFCHALAVFCHALAVFCHACQTSRHRNREGGGDRAVAPNLGLSRPVDVTITRLFHQIPSQGDSGRRDEMKSPAHTT